MQRYEFAEDKIPDMWVFNHDEDRGRPPKVNAWFRDRPTDGGLIDRHVVVLLYQTPVEPSQAGIYRIIYGTSLITPARAAYRPSYTAPGAPGFDPKLMPPMEYPDSLRLDPNDPIGKFGYDAYGRPRGWTEPYACPPD